MDKSEPRSGDIRVWYIPQVPGKPFLAKVESFAEGKKILDVLASFSLFEYQNKIKLDYSEAWGIERYEKDGDGGYDWYEMEDEEPVDG